MEENNMQNQEEIKSEEIKNDTDSFGNDGFPQKFDFTFIKDRAVSLLFAEKDIWQKIKAEEVAPINLMKYYFCPLLAIPVVFYFLSSLFTGSSHSPFISSCLYYVLGVFCAYGSAWVLDKYGLEFINKYSPKVIKSKDKKTGEVTETPLEEIHADITFDNALKAIVYSFTPFCISGIAFLIPSSVIFLCTAALLYNLYLALPTMTDVADVNRMRLLGGFLAVVFTLFAIPACIVFSFI